MKGFGSSITAALVMAANLASGQTNVVVTPAAFDVTAAPGQVVTRTLTIRNLGAENLAWGLGHRMVTSYAPGPTAGQVIESLVPPGRGSGVAFDGSAMWFTSYDLPKTGKLDPNTGGVLGTLNTATGIGLSWDGANLWGAKQIEGLLYATDPVADTRLLTLTLPAGSRPTGVSPGEGYLWVLSDSGNVTKVDPKTGAVKGSWALPAELVGGCYGLEYFNGAIWVAKTSWTVTRIYKLNPDDGTVIRTFDAPGGATMVSDLAATGTSRMWMCGGQAPQASLVETGERVWLKETRSYGLLAAGETQTVQVVLDAAGAGLGVHEATIRVRASDPDGTEFMVPVTFTVAHDPNNLPPVASSVSVGTAANTARQIGLTAMDPNSDWLTYAIVSPPANGTLSGTAPNVMYTPNLNWSGTDSFAFKVADMEYDSNVATVTVHVGANGAPQIASAAWADPNPVTLPAGTTAHVVAFDPDGDPLTYAWSKLSGAGTATFATPAAADSGVTFSAAGSYVLRVTVNDGRGSNVSSDVTVAVTEGSGADPRADCNGDGVVNALDLQIVIANFGQTVP